MRVLISGAGIAGPTLAWFLAKAGVHVTVIEKSDTFRFSGQLVDFEGSAVKVIEKMGLLDQVRQRNSKEVGVNLIDPQGRPFAPFPLREGASVSLTAAFEILRGDLATILYEATKDFPNVDYLFGTTIREVVSNSERSVKVVLSDGQEHEYDLLVAADGQWSKLRKQCFSEESVRIVHKGMYAAYWTIPRLPIDSDWSSVYWALDSRIMALRPDPYGDIKVMFMCMPCNEIQEQTWREASRGDRQAQERCLRKEFADAGWQAERFLDAMEEASDLYFHGVDQVKMSSWSNGRVVCLGDAGYCPSLLTGMGTSLALIGAYVLAGEISNLRDGEHPARALDAYERTYRPFVEKTQKIPSILPGIFHPKTAWKRWLLQFFLWCFSRVLMIPGILRLFPDSTYDDKGFPLPGYTSFVDAKEG